MTICEFCGENECNEGEICDECAIMIAERVDEAAWQNQCDW